MRRLLTFACDKDLLCGTLDEAEGAVGVLLVTGGTQLRIGSHRMYERLAIALAEKGYPCFRFDRRGVGDSSGTDPGYRDSGEDLRAAAGTFRAQAKLDRLIGFGLCDGATTIALHGRSAALDGAIIVNPWLVEEKAGELPPAAVRSHYRQRLLSPSAWKKLLSGGVDLGRLTRSLRKAGGATDGSLAVEAARGLRGTKVALLLAKGDNTAVAAAAEIRRPEFDGLVGWRQDIDTDSHTFARAGDQGSLDAAILAALAELQR